MDCSTVLLDFDGVVRHFDPAHDSSVEAGHGLEKGSLTAAAFDPALLDQVITGRIGRRAWIEQIASSVGDIAAVTEWLANRGSVDEAMLTLVDGLRGHGVVVAVLTNGTDATAAEMRELDLVRRFDAIYNSAEIGFAKPDVRAFAHVCQDLGVDPVTVFFTDDSESKLAGAIELAMFATRFENIEQFRRDLVQVGLG